MEFNQQDINTLVNGKWVDNTLDTYKGFGIICMEGDFKGDHVYIVRAQNLNDRNPFERQLTFNTLKPTRNQAMQETIKLIDNYRGVKSV